MYLDGGSIDATEATIAEQCHFIGHRDGVKAALTVRENAEFYARYLALSTMVESPASGPAPSPGADPIVRALIRLGLDALSEVPAAWLSAGQRRRLGLSRLLLAHRPVWLLDEPTVSLDAASVQTLAEIVAEHSERGGIVIAATHIPLGLGGRRS